MFGLVTAVVVLALGAFAWWVSGRARPGALPPGRTGSVIEDDHVARSQGPRSSGII